MPADVGTLPPMPPEDEGGVTGAFEPVPAEPGPRRVPPAFEPSRAGLRAGARAGVRARA